MLHILPTLFRHYLDIFPNRLYLNACFIDILHSQSLVDLLGKEEIFVSVFPSVGHSSAVNDVIQAWLNYIVEVIEYFAILGTGLDIVSKLLAEGALTTVVWEVGVDQCRFSDIPFRWSFLRSGAKCGTGVVTWSGL